MKVILRADVANLGKRGDILEVADGWGLSIEPLIAARAKTVPARPRLRLPITESEKPRA
jgi:ribosomal protein L9